MWFFFPVCLVLSLKDGGRVRRERHERKRRVIDEEDLPIISQELLEIVSPQDIFSKSSIPPSAPSPPSTLSNTSSLPLQPPLLIHQSPAISSLSMSNHIELTGEKKINLAFFLL